MAGNAFILLVSVLILVIGSEVTIRNSIKVSDITGFGKTTIGFLLVGFSTSLPELSVSVFAAFNPENIGVSLGNVLGSNIVNIALILGVCLRKNYDPRLPREPALKGRCRRSAAFRQRHLIFENGWSGPSIFLGTRGERSSCLVLTSSTAWQ